MICPLIFNKFDKEMNINTSLKMNTGYDIPLLGLGTYLSQPGTETYEAVLDALEIGYRHIDTAAFYQNESDVGGAIRNSGLKREEIFVTTKLWNSEHTYDNALRAFDKSLKNLKLDYIDLYLIHWPQTGTRKDAWKALDKVFCEGLVKSIGVSNYTIRHIEEMKSYSDIVPACNQVEFSLYLYQKELMDYCKVNNIVLAAYTPLVRGNKMKDLKLIDIAKKYSCTPAQILIRWVLEHGVVALPKSSNRLRILENANVFEFNFSQEDMDYLDSFNENYRVAWDPTLIQ